MAEFTVKSVLVGIFFGILFGAANAYLGLYAGITISTSIPVAVLSVGFFRLMQRVTGRASILEANISQTTGSASSSLASGVIFTVPALYLWGYDPPLLQLAGLALAGGLLGILFMIPLRRLLIKEEHGRLPYPEGTACAEVLEASDKGGATATNVFLGLGVGFLYRFFTGFLILWKEKFYVDIPLLKKAQIGLNATPALLGVGYILGFRVSSIMVAGSLVSWVVIIPLIAYFGDALTVPLMPEPTKTIAAMSTSELWSRYIRYIGAGAVAFAGIITIIRSIPIMIRSFGIGMRAMTARFGNSTQPAAEEYDRTDHDVPLAWVGLGVGVIVLALAFIPHLLGGNELFSMRLVAAPAIAVFAFFFVTVSSRIVGLVGVSSNPTSGMTIVTLLGVSMLFVLLGWTDTAAKFTVLTVGTVVCVAASIAGDTSQDLKTGFLVGGTPFKQQVGELIGAASSALAVVAAVALLAKTYQFGSEDLPAPQAVLIQTIIDGVLEAGIPWALVLAGAAFGLVIELCGLPSLPFAVGLYLPVSTMTPIFFGGAIRWFVEKRYANDPDQLAARREQGILFGSGLIGGQGLLSVLIAGWAFFIAKPEGVGLQWPAGFSEFTSLVVFLGLGYLLFRLTKPRA